MVAGKYTVAQAGVQLAVNKAKPIKTTNRAVGVDKPTFRAVLASRARDKRQANMSHRSNANSQTNSSQIVTQKQIKKDDDTSLERTMSNQVNSESADDATKEAVDQIKDAAISMPQKTENGDSQDVTSEFETELDTASEALSEIAALLNVLSVDLVKPEQLSATLSNEQTTKQELAAMIDNLKMQLNGLISNDLTTSDLTAALNLDLAADSQLETDAFKQLLVETTEQFEALLNSGDAVEHSSRSEALATLLNELNGHIEKLTETTQFTSTQTASVDRVEIVQTVPSQTTAETAEDTAKGESHASSGAEETTDAARGFAEVVNQTTQVGFESEQQTDLQIKATQNIKQNQLPLKTAVFKQIKAAIVKESATAGLADRSTMIVKLKPEALGKVELKIEVHNDNVIAKFNVASQMVKEAIESNFEDLRNSLKDKGFNDMAFDVNVNAGDGKRQSAYQQRGKRQSINISSDAEKGETTYIRSLSALINETTFEHTI